MDKMFLAKGFNDFLSKPVEIDKLNDLLEKWVPREKRLHPEVWMAGTIDMAFKAGGM
jgi:response regulator of citrate/malate metabolism